MNKIVIIDQELCTGCATCVDLCPKKILFIDKKSHTCKVTNETKCGKAACCEKACPAGAIKIY